MYFQDEDDEPQMMQCIVCEKEFEDKTMSVIFDENDDAHWHCSKCYNDLKK